MGPSQSKSTQTLQISHPNFKNVQIIQHDKATYMKTKLVLQNTKNFQEWEKAQKMTEDMDDTYLLLPIDHKVQKNAFCGPSAILIILYENFPIILSDQIKSRNVYQEYFQQVEMWYLLYILISTSSKFHQKQTKLGDVRPQNIFVNRGGQIKVSNVFSWPNVENNYFKSLCQNQSTYLAPQQLQQLSAKNPKPQSDPYKAESFSIGLTLLGAMLLKNGEQLYDFNSFAFDAKQLQNWVGKLNAQKLYSQFLRSIVTSLLQINPKNRKSSLEISELIKPYEYQMENLIEFQQQIPRVSHSISTSPFNNDPRSSYKSVDNSQLNIRNNILNSQTKYNYTSNLPTYSPDKNIKNIKEGNYYTSVPNISESIARDSIKTPYLPSNSNISNKFAPLPNYTSNTYTNYQSTSNYVPKTLEQIYNSININGSTKLEPNIDNSPSRALPNYKYNFDLPKPTQPVNPFSSGVKTPGSVIPLQEVDKYIEISKQLYQ